MVVSSIRVLSVGLLSVTISHIQSWQLPSSLINLLIMVLVAVGAAHGAILLTLVSAGAWATLPSI